MKNMTNKKGRKPKNASETPEETYVRLVNGRYVRAVSLIRNIAKSTGNKFYPVEETQVETIIVNLTEEINKIMLAYENRSKQKQEKEKIEGVL